jgi:hypothetical protein
MSTAHVEAVAMTVVATVFVPVAFIARRQGAEGWQGFLIGAAVCYLIAIFAAMGVEFTGWT